MPTSNNTYNQRIAGRRPGRLHVDSGGLGISSLRMWIGRTLLHMDGCPSGSMTGWPARAVRDAALEHMLLGDGPMGSHVLGRLRRIAMAEMCDWRAVQPLSNCRFMVALAIATYEMSGYGSPADRQVLVHGAYENFERLAALAYSGVGLRTRLSRSPRRNTGMFDWGFDEPTRENSQALLTALMTRVRVPDPAGAVTGAAPTAVSEVAAPTGQHVLPWEEL